MENRILSGDAELLAKLRRGDAAGVREWFTLYQPKLLKTVSRKISVEKDAEEVTQDTFLSCLKHLPLFRGESSIWTWMQRVAQHEIADYYRKRYAKKFIHALPLSDLLGIDEITNAHDTSQKVKDILLKMEHESREILQMKYVDKKKVKDIAREMGRTVKAVESILFRARAEFRELYNGGNNGE